MSEHNIHNNPLQTNGFEFLEFSTQDGVKLANDFIKMGFEVSGHHSVKEINHFVQGDINFIINTAENSHALNFSKQHGPSVSAMGFRVANAQEAFEKAIQAGATAYQGQNGEKTFDLPAIFGIGGSLIYLVDNYGSKSNIYQDYLEERETRAVKFISSGLTYIDHVTHNVFRGNMAQWAKFYEDIFNFREIRYFDIKGKMTGLISKAMTSPCGKIRIPLNESTDEHSQIEEFLREYKGEGIQHIALGSADIYSSVEMLQADGVAFLSTPETYFEMIPKRIPSHGEDLDRLKKFNILIDGDPNDKGLLLQIFTENMLGPVFFEIIQRKGNEGFGEGNFQALFDSIELDQVRRGVLKID